MQIINNNIKRSSADNARLIEELDNFAAFEKRELDTFVQNVFNGTIKPVCDAHRKTPIRDYVIVPEHINLRDAKHLLRKMIKADRTTKYYVTVWVVNHNRVIHWNIDTSFPEDTSRMMMNCPLA